MNLAHAMRGGFMKRKRSLLRAVGEERKTAREVLVELERRYRREVMRFLRTEGTTYADWLEHGPLCELDELREAVRHDHLWERLVDKASAPT